MLPVHASDAFHHATRTGMVHQPDVLQCIKAIAQLQNLQLPGALEIRILWVQAVRRALEEIVLKKRPPTVPKAPPKLRQIQAPQPSKPGQRQLELVYVHECRSALSLTWP